MARRGRARNVVSIKCIHCKAREIGLCQPIPIEDLSIVEDIKLGEEQLDAGAHLYHEGDVTGETYNLIEGWIALYHLLPDGRRQILEFLLPGAFFGWHYDAGGPMTHSALCVNDAVVCKFPRQKLIELFMTHPEIALRMTRLCARDRVTVHENLTNLGRRSAIERVAHLLYELHHRLRPGQQWGGTQELPLTQELISDAVGLSPVHTNRTMRNLSRLGAIAYRRGAISIADPDKLARLAALTDDTMLRASA